MPLTLSYRAGDAKAVDLDGITPDRLRDRRLAEIERIPIYHGKRKVLLADLFRVSGDPSDGRIDFDGELGGVDRIGARMSAGEIRVRGDVGAHLGREMSGGLIRVEGDAGNWVGTEMKDGLIRITGSAGDHVGAAYPGSRRGMTDGKILIEGAAGDALGASMRRGLIAVGGSCGASVGSGMIAGSILVFGRCGPHPGGDMRRGTIGLFGPDPPELLPTFRPAGLFRPLFLCLLERELEGLGYASGRGLSEGQLSLYHGDLLSLGKGEIWVRQDGAV